MHAPPEQPPQQSDSRQTLNMAMFVVHAYATSAEVFLHRRFGERYLGFQAAAVFVIVPLHAYFMHEHDPHLLLACLIPYTVACLFHRLMILTRRWRGDDVHSYYCGYPWTLVRGTPRDEVIGKTIIEPLLVGGLGMLLLSEDRVLGSYLLVAGGSLFLKEQMTRQLHRLRDLDQRDAYLEMQHRAERLRR